MDQHEKNVRKFFDLKPFAPREAVKIHFLSLPNYDQLASRHTFADPSPVANLDPAAFAESVKNAETLCTEDYSHRLHFSVTRNEDAQESDAQ